MNRKTLRLIYEKTSGRCWYCGAFHRPLDDWQVEHQNPRIRGGSDALENLVLACVACNAAKGKRTVEEYRAFLIAKLENAITNAREIADEIESLVGWEWHNDGSNGRVLYPPLWLVEVDSLLLDAARKAINTTEVFYGETLATDSAPSQIPVIQSESVT